METKPPSQTALAVRNGYVDPYESIPDEQKKKVAALVSTEDYMFIQGLRTLKGTNQTTVNILLNKLIHELKRLNITTYTDQPAFEQYVASVQLVDGRVTNGVTTPQPHSEASEPNDRRGTPSTSSILPQPANVAPDAPRRTGHSKAAGTGKGRTRKEG